MFLIALVAASSRGSISPARPQTLRHGINNRGQVVGGYLDAEGRPHGFLWDKGRFTTIDVPGAVATQATDINDRGEMVGFFGDDPNDPPQRQGRADFCSAVVTSRRSTPPASLSPSPPASTTAARSWAQQSATPTGTELHGFLLAKGPLGPFTPIDFPGAPNTVAFGINDRGQIVGVYENPDAGAGSGGGPMQMPMTMSGAMTG